MLDLSLGQTPGNGRDQTRTGTSFPVTARGSYLGGIAHKLTGVMCIMRRQDVCSDATAGIV